ncbi:hypothetical protein KDW22_28455, partial [Burkholderia cenocepacia]|nr:hypothetical protein [Burkholderia cenocepacia]
MLPTLTTTERAADFWSDRQLQQFNDAADAEHDAAYEKAFNAGLAQAVAGRRKGAGDGRRNGASRTGGKTRIRTVSRLRFFAVFGNCI